MDEKNGQWLFHWKVKVGLICKLIRSRCIFCICSGGMYYFTLKSLVCIWGKYMSPFSSLVCIHLFFSNELLVYDMGYNFTTTHTHHLGFRWRVHPRDSDMPYCEHIQTYVVMYILQKDMRREGKTCTTTRETPSTWICAIRLPHANILTFHTFLNFVSKTRKYINYFMFVIATWMNKPNYISFCDALLTQGSLHEWRGNLFANATLLHISM